MAETSPRQVERAGVGAGQLGSPRTGSHKDSSHKTTPCIDNPKSRRGALPLSSLGFLAFLLRALSWSGVRMSSPRTWLVSLLPSLRGLGKRGRTFSPLRLTHRCIQNLSISCFVLLPGAGPLPYRCLQAFSQVLNALDLVSLSPLEELIPLTFTLTA